MITRTPCFLFLPLALSPAPSPHVFFPRGGKWGQIFFFLLCNLIGAMTLVAAYRAGGDSWQNTPPWTACPPSYSHLFCLQCVWCRAVMSVPGKVHTNVIKNEYKSTSSTHLHIIDCLVHWDFIVRPQITTQQISHSYMFCFPTATVWRLLQHLWVIWIESLVRYSIDSSLWGEDKAVVLLIFKDERQLSGDLYSRTKSSRVHDPSTHLATDAIRKSDRVE